MQTTLAKQTIIHRKPYLVPFERMLAELEATGLGLHPEPAGGLTYRVDGPANKLNRLAYYDWVAEDVCRPTTQAVREGARPDTDPRGASLPSRRTHRFAPHDWHEYRGRFLPQLVRALINTSPDGIMFDPFCGGGTSVVEARALGLESHGLDTNPLAVLIAQAKADAVSWTAQEAIRIGNIIQNVTNTADPRDTWSEPDHQYLSRWFAPEALTEIAGIVTGLNFLEGDARTFGLVCLSDVLRASSYQKLDDLRTRRDVRAYHPGSATEAFRARSTACIRSLVPALAAGRFDAPCRVEVGDARRACQTFPELIGCVDAVVTSPPYATALPYLDTDRLSLVVLGLLPRAEHATREKIMVGSREITERTRLDVWQAYDKTGRDLLHTSVTDVIDGIAATHHHQGGFRARNLPALLARYFLDMRTVLQQVWSMLKAGSPAWVVVGSNSTRVAGTRSEIHTWRLLEQIARQEGFTIHQSIPMDGIVSRDPFSRNSGVGEHILRLTG